MRKVAILTGSAYMLWLVLTYGLSGPLEATQPELAVRVRPHDARAKAFLALSLLDENDGHNERAAQLARDAARRDPTLAIAPMALAQIYESSNPAEASSLYRYSDALSRRETATQVALIGDAVRRDDVAEALNHFDAGLSTSPSAWPLMIPVLARALDDQRLVRPIAQLIARNRWWAQNALTAMIEQSVNSSRLTDVAVILPSLGFFARPDVTQRLFDRLILENRAQDLQRLYVAVVRPLRSGKLNDGQFSHPTGYRPFRWMFTQGVNESAERLAPNDAPDDPALSLHVEPGDHAVILVRQLLLLPPGDYRLSARLRSNSYSSRAVAWHIQCARDGSALARLPWASSVSWQTIGTNLHVPDGCAQQWILARAEAGADPFSGWADDIAVARLALPRPSGERKAPVALGAS